MFSMLSASSPNFVDSQYEFQAPQFFDFTAVQNGDPIDDDASSLLDHSSYINSPCIPDSKPTPLFIPSPDPKIDGSAVSALKRRQLKQSKKSRKPTKVAAPKTNTGDQENTPPASIQAVHNLSQHHQHQQQRRDRHQYLTPVHKPVASAAVRKKVHFQLGTPKSLLKSSPPALVQTASEQSSPIPEISWQSSEASISSPVAADATASATGPSDSPVPVFGKPPPFVAENASATVRQSPLAQIVETAAAVAQQETQEEEKQSVGSRRWQKISQQYLAKFQMEGMTGVRFNGRAQGVLQVYATQQEQEQQQQTAMVLVKTPSPSVKASDLRSNLLRSMNGQTGSATKRGSASTLRPAFRSIDTPLKSLAVFGVTPQKQSSNDASLATEATDSSMSVVSARPRKPYGHGYKRVRALADYDGDSRHRLLSFRKDEAFSVIGIVDGKYRAVHKGKTGFVPANLVVEVSSPSSARLGQRQLQYQFQTTPNSGISPAVSLRLRLATPSSVGSRPPSLPSSMLKVMPSLPGTPSFQQLSQLMTPIPSPAVGLRLNILKQMLWTPATPPQLPPTPGATAMIVAPRQPSGATAIRPVAATLLDPTPAAAPGDRQHHHRHKGQQKHRRNQQQSDDDVAGTLGKQRRRRHHRSKSTASVPAAGVTGLRKPGEFASHVLKAKHEQPAHPTTFKLTIPETPQWLRRRKAERAAGTGLQAKTPATDLMDQLDAQKTKLRHDSRIRRVVSPVDRTRDKKNRSTSSTTTIKLPRWK